MSAGSMAGRPTRVVAAQLYECATWNCMRMISFRFTWVCIRPRPPSVSTGTYRSADCCPRFWPRRVNANGPAERKFDAGFCDGECIQYKRLSGGYWRLRLTLSITFKYKSLHTCLRMLGGIFEKQKLCVSGNSICSADFTFFLRDRNMFGWKKI